jgi:protein gp37
VTGQAGDGRSPDTTRRRAVAAASVQVVGRLAAKARLGADGPARPGWPDLFDPQVDDELIARVFAVMALTPQRSYLVVTGHTQRMRQVLTASFLGEDVRHAIARAAQLDHQVVYDPRMGEPDFARRHQARHASGRDPYRRLLWPGWPLPNVWLGARVEVQRDADERLPALLASPAAGWLVACWPLRGPVDLHAWLPPAGGPTGRQEPTAEQGELGWVIAAGGCGRGARAVHPAWARTLRNACRTAGVAFSFPQWGDWAVAGGERRRGDRWVTPTPARGFEDFNGWPHWSPGAVRMRRVGVAAAGRTLDGRTWAQCPRALATTGDHRRSGAAGRRRRRGS